MAKLVCFSLFVFRYSYFALCFPFSFSVFVFHFSLFTIRFSFFAFHFSFFFSFQIGPNVVFWHSKSYFDIRNRVRYRIVTILFWHSNLGRISYCDIQNPILTFELGPNIVFWHSISYFDIQKMEPNVVFWNWKILFWHWISDRISYFDIQNPILPFKLRRNIVFWQLKSYFDIQTRSDFRILTFKILS